MTNLTAAQEKHMAVLTREFKSMKSLRQDNGFCNLSTLRVLRAKGLVEAYDPPNNGVLENLMWRKTQQ